MDGPPNFLSDSSIDTQRIKLPVIDGNGMHGPCKYAKVSPSQVYQLIEDIEALQIPPAVLSFWPTQSISKEYHAGPPSRLYRRRSTLDPSKVTEHTEPIACAPTYSDSLAAWSWLATGSRSARLACGRGRSTSTELKTHRITSYKRASLI